MVLIKKSSPPDAPEHEPLAHAATEPAPMHDEKPKVAKPLSDRESIVKFLRTSFPHEAPDQRRVKDLLADQIEKEIDRK